MPRQQAPRPATAGRTWPRSVDCWSPERAVIGGSAGDLDHGLGTAPFRQCVPLVNAYGPLYSPGEQQARPQPEGGRHRVLDREGA